MISKENLLPFLFFDSTIGAHQHSIQANNWLSPSEIWGFSDPSSQEWQFDRFLFPLLAFHASTFLSPLAPYPLRYFFATMETLTPISLSPNLQVSLVHMTRPSLHSVTNHLTHSAIALFIPSQRDGLPGVRTLSPPRSGLRTLPAGSPKRPAESCSSSYGLQVRLQLLSTLPHGNAVTFNYRERASPGRGLSPLRSSLLPGALARAFQPVQKYSLFFRSVF